jgi:hypothetical protein
VAAGLKLKEPAAVGGDAIERTMVGMRHGGGGVRVPSREQQGLAAACFSNECSYSCYNMFREFKKIVLYGKSMPNNVPSHTGTICTAPVLIEWLRAALYAYSLLLLLRDPGVFRTSCSCVLLIPIACKYLAASF